MFFFHLSPSFSFPLLLCLFHLFFSILLYFILVSFNFHNFSFTPFILFHSFSFFSFHSLSFYPQLSLHFLLYFFLLFFFFPACSLPLSLLIFFFFFFFFYFLFHSLDFLLLLTLHLSPPTSSTSFSFSLASSLFFPLLSCMTSNHFSSFFLFSSTPHFFPLLLFSVFSSLPYSSSFFIYHLLPFLLLPFLFLQLLPLFSFSFIFHLFLLLLSSSFVLYFSLLPPHFLYLFPLLLLLHLSPPTSCSPTPLSFPPFPSSIFFFFPSLVFLYLLLFFTIPPPQSPSIISPLFLHSLVFLHSYFIIFLFSPPPFITCYSLFPPLPSLPSFLSFFSHLFFLLNFAIPPPLLPFIISSLSPHSFFILQFSLHPLFFIIYPSPTSPLLRLLHVSFFSHPLFHMFFIVPLPYPPQFIISFPLFSSFGRIHRIHLSRGERVTPNKCS